MNHRTADIALREKIAGNSDVILATNAEIMHSARVSGVITLATCNRTELYVETKSRDAVLNWFAQRLGLANKDLKQYTYMHTDLDAIRHLMRLASGLDSMVLGEVEILGQLKAAYKLALQQGNVTTTLSRLFECGFSVAKKVRTQTEIGVNPVSVAYLAVRLAERIFTRISEQVVLLIGAGDTAQLMLKHLAGAGVKHFIIANRTRAHAEALVKSCGPDVTVEFIELNLVPEVLARADIVVTATNAPLPIVGKGMVENAIKARKYRAMFMIDLAVPRNIEPQVQQIADVYLYGIDDLQNIAAEHKQTRYTAVPQAEIIIDQEVHKFVAWLDTQQAVTTLQAFRRRCEYRRDQSLDEALQQLNSGKDPREVLQKFGHVLLNRLLHEPTIQLRKASVAGNNELLNIMRELFET
ncbi:MAG TPA: glutamyl-tRNA reductase [Gammaproteobacteria bacterium]|nr:glutamyl-tRNA reductase [Gammaproteobacteria bacterium]